MPVFLSCYPLGAGGHVADQGKILHPLLPVTQAWGRLALTHGLLLCICGSIVPYLPVIHVQERVDKKTYGHLATNFV